MLLGDGPAVENYPCGWSAESSLFGQFFLRFYTLNASYRATLRERDAESTVLLLQKGFKEFPAVQYIQTARAQDARNSSIRDYP